MLKTKENTANFNNKIFSCKYLSRYMWMCVCVCLGIYFMQIAEFICHRFLVGIAGFTGNFWTNLLPFSRQKLSAVRLGFVSLQKQNMEKFCIVGEQALLTGFGTETYLRIHVQTHTYAFFRINICFRNHVTYRVNYKWFMLNL